MCQAEDHFGEWRETTKALYKDLVTVQKGNTGALEIASAAFVVDGGGESGLFKTKSVHNRMYVVCDEVNDYVNVVYKVSERGLVV